ncbi:MAG: hypothetical protein V4550_21060 [Gemmatimonadota bacterium]
MKKEENRREPTGAATVLGAVTALIDERKKFEEWIAGLDAKRDATPDHVFRRVHADYATRLDVVVRQLESHADALRRELEALTNRSVALEESRQQALDTRAESALRAHVGELSSEQWTTLAAASDAQLADLASRQAEVEREVGKTQRLLAEAERPAALLPPVITVDPGDSVPLVAETPVAEVEEVASEPVVEPLPPVVAPIPEAIASSPPAIRISRGAEQQSLGIETPPRVTPPPLPPRESMHTPRSSKFDELAFLSSVVDTPAGSVDPAPADQADERTRRDTFASRGKEESIVNLTGTNSAPVDKPPQAYEKEGDPLLAGTAPLDGAKTLKCGDCGALNYPTEWYCERCGAELASL